MKSWLSAMLNKKMLLLLKKAVEGAGDIWTWTAICVDTKLIPSWAVGNCDAETAKPFIEDLASRLKNKVQ